MQLDPSQARAVDLMVSAPFCAVTGGPGTGKSTTLRVALDQLDARGRTYALASPTGKAAKRMTETTGRPACTLHRLLGIGRDGRRIVEERVEVDNVFVDESSMLDVELAALLMGACDPSTRVCFIGDANQLPSVGPGRVLADLVESEAVPVARLTHVHRAAAESWVCRNAPRVLAGQPLELEACRDFRFVEADSAEDTARAVTELVTNGELVGAQILAPQRTAACGVESLNLGLQATLNPAEALKPEWKLGDKLFRRGDRVIQTVNNYKLDDGRGVFNGEVGEVLDVGSLLTVDFGDRRVAYDKPDAMKGLELAYALTVHKSQGSEFAWVIVVVHSAHTHMLTRQLFYTAITRAKRGVVIVGNRKGLAAALSGKEPPKRNTGLVDRMRELMGEAAPPAASAATEPVKESELPSAAEGDEIPW